MLSLHGTLGGSLGGSRSACFLGLSSPRLSPPGGAIGLDGRLRRYRRFHQMEKASGGQQRACVWCASSSSSSEPAEHPRDETGLDDSAPPQPSRSFGVVITGSTKGIGLAMARTHLALGDRVVINSRDADRVQASVAELTAEFGDDNVCQRKLSPSSTKRT